MNAPQSLRPVNGRLDDRGRLVEADPPLLRLQERAGGVEGGMLALPQLATLARLSRRLGISISRQVVVGYGDQDVDLWVRVAPDPSGVELAITGWQEMAPLQPSPGIDALRWRDFSRATADWIVETDAMLRITQPPSNLPGAVGQPVEALFAMSSDGDGVSAIVAAARTADRFQDDGATFLLGQGIPVRIAGVPLIGGGVEGLAGYQLLVSRRDAPLPLGGPRLPDPVPLDEAFGGQLSRAMREPLDRIIRHADNISRRDDGPVRRDYAAYAEDIAGAGRHLLALVDDLVDLQTIERADFRPDVEKVDLVDTAQRAAGLLAVRAANADVRIDGPGQDGPVIARGDFRRILQVLINLLNNAIRHSPAGGTVWIRCEAEDGIAAVIVADAGDGIAPENQERVFERFERLGLRDGTGSGLGLYISRRLARAMGGDLGVDSARGQGARFVLTLPVGH
ncbi:sensor histidine kinase [Rhizorhabdus dicambivorans]|uniref:histidine kinase n=1 Tax=Rhizorhabdus dicambivorans TaxID=1850238 RepID=A0A2A4FZQ9_9SPHN|nr:HAMP domain-containing sensor histidine kinase [Rhizorhabdus dicambivorans]ATE63058.1 sensor histidine kinase [Rhizorhabdus dicambivorans]PCE43235.1 sensor histidine kinase [Rhizorhabdus dicambivorans]